MKNSTIKQAKFIARGKTEADLEKAQEILMEYLKYNPKDTQVWLLLIMTECNPPLYDYDRIAHYVDHILSYDPTNPYALLLLSYADHYLTGGSNDNVYDKLKLAQSDDSEILAMLELAKGRYFRYRDEQKYEEALKKSIEYSSSQVRNFCELGKLYVDQGHIEKGKKLIKCGLKNVKNLLTIEDCHNRDADPTSIEDLLEEFFSGTTINVIQYGSLGATLNTEEEDKEDIAEG